MHHNLDVKVTVPVAKLIEALRKNKEKHQEDYKRAVVVFFSEAADELATLLLKVNAGVLNTQFNWSKARPVDNTALYNKYIGMFLMATEENITISAEEYSAIVDDNWSWAASASALNGTYSSKFAG